MVKALCSAVCVLLWYGITHTHTQARLREFNAERKYSALASVVARWFYYALARTHTMHRAHWLQIRWRAIERLNGHKPESPRNYFGQTQSVACLHHISLFSSSSSQRLALPPLASCSFCCCCCCVVELLCVLQFLTPITFPICVSAANVPLFSQLLTVMSDSVICIAAIFVARTTALRPSYCCARCYNVCIVVYGQAGIAIFLCARTAAIWWPNRTKNK